MRLYSTLATSSGPRSLCLYPMLCPIVLSPKRGLSIFFMSTGGPLQSPMRYALLKVLFIHGASVYKCTGKSIIPLPCLRGVLAESPPLQRSGFLSKGLFGYIIQIFPECMEHYHGVLPWLRAFNFFGLLGRCLCYSTKMHGAF